MTESWQEISLSDIFKAQKRIKEFLDPTPSTKSCFLDEFAVEVTLKEENLSTTGSWFDRAVLNALLVLSEEQRRRGVITVSENKPFIRALYHFGPKLGIPVILMVPVESEIQEELLSRPGRVIVSCGFDIEETRRYAEELAKGIGLEVINSDLSYPMLAGLCTLGLEIADQCGSNIDAILVPYMDRSILKALKCSLKFVLPRVQIIGVNLDTKEKTRVSRSSDKEDSLEDAVLCIREPSAFQAVIRVIEEYSVKKEKGTCTEMVDVVSPSLAQLRYKRVVVVVSSDCLVHSPHHL
ncbi:L-threonine dehydratase catabolic TdcB-like [Montipora foliosa]|uniref:L-threonine dehydratase catabolic TdcB-like n=1 Tax=Montipora foliosa TaxID=591990 RepID=UPI0035F11563